MIPQFTVWSLTAIPLLTALYVIGFLFKNNGLQKYYTLPKCAGSFLCVCSAAMASVLAGGLPFEHLLFWALVLCLAGDYLIEHQIIAGGIAFGSAHCLIMAYALGRGPVNPISLALWAVVFSLFLLAFLKEMSAMGKLLLPFICYAAVLTGGFSFAAVLPFSAGAGLLPLPIGLLSFLVSDMILGKRHFGCRNPHLSLILMALYYLAIYLIAATLWFS